MAGTRPGGPDALPVILHGILHFSRRVLLFAPKGGTILLLVPTRFCGRIRRKSAWRGQNGRDKTARFDPGGAQTAFGTQNSKCDRALTAPPEFKSLMLRQKKARTIPSLPSLFFHGRFLRKEPCAPAKKEENRDWKWRGPRAMINASNQKEKRGFLSISGGREFAVR